MLCFRRFVHKTSKYAHLFPENLFNKKHKTPAYLYVAEDQLAEQIDKAIEPFMKQTKCHTAMEINPGIGLFTNKLLNRETRIRKILLYETLEHFMPALEDLHTLYPDRVKVKQADIVSIPKLVYQDKMDNGTRVADSLCDLPKRAYSDDPIALLFGAVGSYNFFKHLINSIIFQHGLLNFGRLEMYLAMPPPTYIHLTCNNEIGYLFYRSASILFQILFEHRFITKLPRAQFLPNQIDKPDKSVRLRKVNSIDRDCLYLVRIVPRRYLFDICPQIDFLGLWYFVKQNCVSRRNRIIPNLEKWIPGCGPRLIINSRQRKTVQLKWAEDAAIEQPKYSTLCTTMNSRDYYQRMNIFTEFGDLSPSQMLTLFRQFRAWPEYSESSFVASLENTLLKMEVAADENSIDIKEEDDVASDIANDEAVEEESRKADVAKITDVNEEVATEEVKQVVNEEAKAAKFKLKSQ
ncbi:dimethyladenosine transferase 2, mitochondrial [Eurosta solidaginis]|uniref:dimethyladenosine transferase 2, mitochondrial n=1 Tax=Eurosta solidaginis TaxID=178769 RepID=UPI0035312AD5